MISIRTPESIHQTRGEIKDGTFHGRWHFSFGEYYDPRYMNFGALRVFNDDILSPGAIWPLHPHRDNEVVTYCVEGEFRHADQRGEGGILKKGWVQHTTVGRGMMHSEINNLPDRPMRFIQMWFLPWRLGLDPSVEQKEVEKPERTNRFLPLVSNIHPTAMRIESDVRVYSCFLENDMTINYGIDADRGAYIYVLEGGPVNVNGRLVPALGAAMTEDETEVNLISKNDSELLVVDTIIDAR
jgi:quercetin 2,3-dioxygenase